MRTSADGRKRVVAALLSKKPRITSFDTRKISLDSHRSVIPRGTIWLDGKRPMICDQIAGNDTDSASEC